MIYYVAHQIYKSRHAKAANLALMGNQEKGSSTTDVFATEYFTHSSSHISSQIWVDLKMSKKSNEATKCF